MIVFASCDGGEDKQLVINSEEELSEEVKAAIPEDNPDNADKGQEQGVDWIQKNQDFLRENSERDEVHITGSGNQFEILEEGSGHMPDPEAEFVVHYEGSLIDGTIFDSSFERNQPLATYLNQVIPGWGDVLPRIKIGTTCKMFIPYHQAYGEKDLGPIPGYSTLVFKVKLIGTRPE